jgi:hypothetical protein
MEMVWRLYEGTGGTAPVAGRMPRRTGRNDAHCLGWPLQRQGHPQIVSNRFAETIFGTRP